MSRENSSEKNLLGKYSRLLTLAYYDYYYNYYYYLRSLGLQSCDTGSRIADRQQGLVVGEDIAAGELAH